MRVRGCGVSVRANWVGSGEGWCRNLAREAGPGGAPRGPCGLHCRGSPRLGVWLGGGVRRGIPPLREFQVLASGPASFSEVTHPSSNRSRGPGAAQPTARRGAELGRGLAGPGEGARGLEGLRSGDGEPWRWGYSAQGTGIRGRNDGKRGALLPGTPEPGGGCAGASRGRPGTRGWRHIPAAPSTLRDCRRRGFPEVPGCPAPLAWSDFRVVIPNFLLLRVRFLSWLGSLPNWGCLCSSSSRVSAEGILLSRIELTGLRISRIEFVPCPRTLGILGYILWGT